MSKFYLIFSLYFSFISVNYAQQIPEPMNVSDTTSILKIDEEKVVQYPGKPLIMSLVFPGTGQYYNKSPMWKVLGFIGAEFGSLIAWKYFLDDAEKKKNEYQDYADLNWSLDDWVFNRYNFPGQSTLEDRSWSSFSSLQTLQGTHHLQLIISGELANELNISKVSSDSLENNLGWVLDPVNRSNITVVRDRHFYENIGKYDQFVGGWTDAREEWYWEEKDVGDSVEIIIKTPMKNDYINQRYNSNRMLTAAKYSITVLMFNHVISGIETVWSSQKKAIRKKDERAMLDSNINLVYDPESPIGVGGIKFSVNF
tara:strand:- start:398 stop:1333 length:936 start_codon:yes stop_codon:yes gene_type:complete